MATLIVKVDDERTESLKKILSEIPYVHEVEEEHSGNQLQEPSEQYYRIKSILDKSKAKDLFKDIQDPSEWQREIRKEWDRDF